MGCHFLRQGIFPTQGSNLSLLPCRRIRYLLSRQDPKKALSKPDSANPTKLEKGHPSAVLGGGVCTQAPTVLGFVLPSGSWYPNQSPHRPGRQLGLCYLRGGGCFSGCLPAAPPASSLHWHLFVHYLAAPITQPHFSLPFSLIFCHSLSHVVLAAASPPTHPWPWKTCQKSKERWRTGFWEDLFYSSEIKLDFPRCPGWVGPRCLIRIFRQKSWHSLFLLV